MMRTTGTQTNKLLVLVAGALAISMAPILVKWAAIHGHVGLIAAAFWRVVLATPVFFIMGAASGSVNMPAAIAPARRGRDYLWLTAPGLFFAADLATWHASFEYTTLANATLLANLATVLVAIVGRIWLKERFTWLFPLGGMVALVGTAVVVNASRGLSESAVKGDVLAIITAVFYSGYILSIKLLRAKWDTTTLMAWSTLTSAVVLLPISIWEGDGFWPLTLYGWLALIGLALISHCGGQGMIAYALAHLPASLSSISLLVQPVSAAILSWFFLSQELTGRQIIGGIVVLCGIFLARLGSRL